MYYFIEKEMIGPEATSKDVDKMVEMLTALGYNVKAGDPVDNDVDYIPEMVWQDCLYKL